MEQPSLILRTILAGLALATAAAADDLPALHIEPEVLELGAVLDDQEIDIPFLVTNHSDDTVAIQRLGTTCEPCFVYHLENPILKPGETSILFTKFWPAGLRGPLRLRLALDISADGPPPSAFIETTIVSRFDVRGGPVIFDDLVEGETRQWHLFVKPRIPCPERYTRLEFQHPGFRGEVDYREKTEDYRVTVFAGPDLPTGPSHDLGTLVPEGPDCASLTLPVLAYRLPRIHLAPSRVVLEPVDRTQLRILFFRQNGGKTPAVITAVDLPGESITCRVEPDSLLHRYKIFLYCSGLSEVSGDIGDIVIHLSDEETPSIAVPVQVASTRGVVVPSGCRSPYEAALPYP